MNYPAPQKDGMTTVYEDGTVLIGGWRSRLAQWRRLQYLKGGAFAPENPIMEAYHYRFSLRNRLIRFLRLRGSWHWAQRQLLQGKIITCEHFSGSLKYKLDSVENGRLMQSYSSRQPYMWESANWFVDNGYYTDYKIWQPS